MLPAAWLDGTAAPHGHSIEVRLYAEDPYRNFAPSPGVIQALRWPEGPGVRNDAGAFEGSEVSIHYDPMIAKLIVWGRGRGQAIRRLDRALAELRVEGIQTSAPLFRQILADDNFQAGRLDIGMLDRKLQDGTWGRPETDDADDLPLLAAILAHADRQAAVTSVSSGPADRAPRHAWRAQGRREAVTGGAS